CALVDLQLCEYEDTDLISVARASGYDAPIIITAVTADFSTAVKAGSKGAFDFLQKPVPDAGLLGVVEKASEAHEIQRKKNGSVRSFVDRYRLLTDREREVFWLLADGCITKAVAEVLHISIRTAEAHRSKVLEKFRTKKVADLVR